MQKLGETLIIIIYSYSVYIYSDSVYIKRKDHSIYNIYHTVISLYTHFQTNHKSRGSYVHRFPPPLLQSINSKMILIIHSSPGIELLSLYCLCILCLPIYVRHFSVLNMHMHMHTSDSIQMEAKSLIQQKRENMVHNNLFCCIRFFLGKFCL